MPDMALDLDVIDTIPQYNLGAKYEDPISGAIYRYVKYDDGTAVTATAGAPVQFLSNSKWVVSGDLSEQADTQAAGFVQAALADTNYGWIQRAGYNRKVITTDGSVADGEALVADVSNDAQVDTMAAGEEDAIMGVALAADSTASTLAAGNVIINME